MLNKDVLQPVECRGLIRLGNKKDGGYVIPGAQVAKTRHLISLGLSHDWSFEKYFLRLNPSAHLVTFDHSVGSIVFGKRFIKSLPQALFRFLILDKRRAQKHADRALRAIDYFLFFRGDRIHIRKKVSGRDDGHHVSINSIIGSLPDLKNQSVFLKMDIEGSEYDVIPDIIKNAHSINCITAEFHHLNTKTDIFNEAIVALSSHFRIVHIHGNNIGIMDPIQKFPESVEITFLHISSLNPPLTPSLRPYPVEGLDYPNDPEKPDYDLRFD